MLATTCGLLRTQGYNATGLNQILKESGAPKGSLYHHFPGGKEQLAIEALDATAKEMGRKLYLAFEETDSIQAALERLIDIGVAELEESDYQCGCPVATVALEATPEKIREACNQVFLGAQKLIESQLLLDGHSPEQAGALANLMFAAYEGALMLSRTQRDPQPLLKLKQTLPLVLR